MGSFYQPAAVDPSEDEAAIRALEDKFAAAFNAGAVDAMMKNYIPDKSLGSYQTYVETAPAGTVVVTHFPLKRILIISCA
jgi:hypothetical protein